MDDPKAAIVQAASAFPCDVAQRSSSGCTHLYGVISRRSVNLIMRTGGLKRRVPHERHRKEGSSFQIGVSRALRIASRGRLARVLHRQHSISSQP